MRVIRSNGNTRMRICIDDEADRQLMNLLFARGLNTLEPIPVSLLRAHDEIKRPLAPAKSIIEARGIAARAE